MIDDVTKETLGEEDTALYQNAIDTINNVMQEGAKYAGTQMQNTGPSMVPANGPGGTLQYDWSRYANPNVQVAVEAIRTASAQKALNDTLQEMYRQARKNYQNASNNYNYSGNGGGNGNGGVTEIDASNGIPLAVKGITVNGEPIDTSGTTAVSPAEQSDAILKAEQYLGVSPTNWDNVDWATGRINTSQSPASSLYNNKKMLDVGVLNNGW